MPLTPVAVDAFAGRLDPASSTFHEDAKKPPRIGGKSRPLPHIASGSYRKARNRTRSHHSVRGEGWYEIPPRLWRVCQSVEEREPAQSACWHCRQKWIAPGQVRRALPDSVPGRNRLRPPAPEV